MKTIDLSIVIVNYNTKDFLKKCIQSIYDAVTQHITLEIIVVDNASTDGTSEEITAKTFQHENFKIILNKENVGFSKANNIGIQQAKGRYVLFLNADTIVHKYTLEDMVAFMDHHKDAGAATCYLKLADGSLDDAAHRGFPTPWNSLAHFSGLGKLFPSSSFFNGYHLGYKDLERIHEIDALAGAFMIVRREAGEAVGWWDEDYFFYGEDLDFCYKLKQLGWKIYFVPHVAILHYKGVSGGIKEHSQKLSTADMTTKKRATKARFDAMRIFYRKHYGKKYPKIVTKLVMMAVNYKEVRSLAKYI